MDEFRARHVVDALRDRGVNAHLLRAGVGQYGVRVSLPGGREAEWDTDGTAGLEAQVMLDGMLVGYVPQIEGSEDFDESQVVDAIARTDYDQPIARQRTVASPVGHTVTPRPFGTRTVAHRSRAGMLSYPRRIRVGRRRAPGRSRMSGNRSVMARNPTSPSIRASEAPRQ